MYYSALIGNPTRHSISHVMYEELAKAARLDDAYKHIKIDVGEKDLQKALTAFRTLHFVGLNVTLPHKLAVIPILDDVDAVVRELGAVNVIKVRETLTGYNTDWMGIYKPLQRHKRTFSTVTIFGSGGAARAAIYAAKRLGAKTINVFYREQAESEKTSDLKARSHDLGIKLYGYNNVRDVVDESELIINATSAGMVGRDSLPFDLQELTGLELSHKTYFDVVFKPLETPLLSYFQSQGAETIDGLWMMIHQGVAAMEIWLEQDVSLADSKLRSVHSSLVKELMNSV